MKKFFPIIILTVISSFLIFYRFPEIPKYLAYDEIEFTKLALSLDNKPYLPYSQLATGHSTLYFYILLASLKTFGINVFALRLPAAVFGILSILVFYLLMKKIFKSAFVKTSVDKQYNNEIMKQYLPFFLTLIFLTSHWFLNFSRFSFEATFLLFLELTSIYFLISKKYLFVSGIFAGLAFISYTPGRIFFLLPIGFLLFNNLPAGRQVKQWNNETIKRLLYFLIPFIIVITPLTSYLLTHQDSRIDKLFFWRNHEMTLNEKIAGTAENVKSITLMFFTKGDMNGKHNYPGKPALNPVLGLLFVIGLVVTMKQWNNSNNKLFLIYFALSISPSLAIYPWENPSMLRTFTVIPSVVYFIGIAIFKLSEAASRIFVSKKIFISYFLFLVILFSCLYELRTYFKYQAPVFEHSFEIRYPLKKAIKMKNVYEKVP